MDRCSPCHSPRLAVPFPVESLETSVAARPEAAQSSGTRLEGLQGPVSGCSLLLLPSKTTIVTTMPVRWDWRPAPGPPEAVRRAGTDSVLPDMMDYRRRKTRRHRRGTACRLDDIHLSKIWTVSGVMGWRRCVAGSATIASHPSASVAVPAGILLE